jgi:hypothetical protein
VDGANQVETQVDGDFPDAGLIMLVRNNLNTCATASLYKAFEQEFRIWEDRFYSLPN